MKGKISDLILKVLFYVVHLIIVSDVKKINEKQQEAGNIGLMTS